MLLSALGPEVVGPELAQPLKIRQVAPKRKEGSRRKKRTGLFGVAGVNHAVPWLDNQATWG